MLQDGVKLHEGRAGAYGRFLLHAHLVLETDLLAYRAMQRAFVERVAARGLSGGP